MNWFSRLLRWIRKGDEKSNLERHAENELRIAGFFDKDSVYNGNLGCSVMELVSVFARQGHSGMSAMATLRLFSTVAAFEPLIPLQGTEDEWGAPLSEDGTRQNKRCSHVFMRKDGTAYDIDGRVFREPNGACYTNRDSFVDVTFPYTPKTEYVPSPVVDEAEKTGGE